MRIKNYKKFCCFEYISTTSEHYQLGDIVIKKDDNEIGVIIQIHEDLEYRTDMFGNCSYSEIRVPTIEEVIQYRSDLYKFWKQEQEPITDVVFRKFKEGDVIALFPNEYYYSILDKDTILSYLHVGQHSGASYSNVMKTTKQASEDEYKDLYNELISIGYNLNVINK